MSDMISRSALIEELNKYLINHYSIHKSDLAEAIAKQPSVEPVRGEWIVLNDGYEVFYHCSECGKDFILFDGGPEENNYNFCPNCGADTRKKVT